MINLTQHLATSEQGPMTAQAVDNPTVLAALTVQPSAPRQELTSQVKLLVNWVQEYPVQPVMVGGHFCLTLKLAKELRWLGYLVVQSESAREVRETRQADGTVKKISVFKHQGWRVLGDGTSTAFPAGTFLRGRLRW